MCLNTVTPYQRMSNNAAGMIPIVRLGKDKLTFHVLHHVTAITFLIMVLLLRPAYCLLYISIKPKLYCNSNNNLLVYLFRLMILKQSKRQYLYTLSLAFE
jgi:hypothetical protein